MRRNKLYVRYDTNYPFLPVAIATSVKELAEMLGKSYNVVSSGISKKQSTYAVIDMDEEEEAECCSR